MSDPIRTVCRHCGTVHQVHQHDVSVDNRGALTCPNCGGELIRWSGKVFYTLAVDIPQSSADMPVVDDDEAAEA